MSSLGHLLNMNVSVTTWGMWGRHGYLLGQEGAVALWEVYDPMSLVLKDTLAYSALTLTVSLSTCELTSCL